MRDAEQRVGWRMAGLGMEVSCQVAAGAALGYLYDRWIGGGQVGPGLLVGAIAGIAVAMWTLIKGALKLNRELDRTSPIDTSTMRRVDDAADDRGDTWGDESEENDGPDDDRRDQFE